MVGLLLVVEKNGAGPDSRLVMTRFLQGPQLKNLTVYLLRMLTAAPPTRPVSKLPVNQRDRIYYTIHSHPNNAFTLKINDDIRTAVVGFRELEDAVLISTMIETHFLEKKEWPDTTHAGTLVLPEGRLEDLTHIFIRQWEFDDLKLECTKNVLDMISVDEILKRKLSYSFAGSLFKFQATDDFYRARFDEIYEQF